MTTAGPSVFAVGGADPAIGNNAFCYGAPSSDGPLIFDMATAVVACGKIRYHDMLSEPLPQGWAAGRDGQPSTSSRILDEGGGVLSLGYKGFGFACMVDLFAGLLVGGCVGMDVGRQRERPDEPTGCSQQIIAMQPAIADGFPEMVAAHARRLRSLRQSDPCAPICAPGDLESRHAELATLNGIELAPPMVDRLRRIEESICCPLDSFLTPCYC
jgi:LDH2 family malate/lactate/ureidoglycolate dehydrogenase